MKKRKGAGRLAVVTATAMVLTLMSSAVPQNGAAKSKSKPPSLSASGKTLETRTDFKLKVKKNSAKEIVKTSWSIKDGGDNIIALTDKKKTSVKVLALNDPGEAKVKAKVKYKTGSKTKTKKLSCSVIVKQGEVTPAPYTPAPEYTPVPQYTTTPTPVVTQTPAPQVGTVNYNAANSSFEVTFSSPQQCSVAADKTDAAGAKQWVTNVSKVIKISWQGSSNYVLPVTSATMDSTGTRLAIFTNPGPMRLGSQYDITLTGFYGAGESTNNNIKMISMTSPITSLQAVVDNNLTQAIIGPNNTVCLSVCFNQPMKCDYAFDRSPSVTGTQELGGWQANANQLARVYEVANSTVSSTPLSIAGVTAYKPQNDDGIERVVIDLGISVTNSTKEYQIQLTGFNPAKAGGISTGTTLQTSIKYTPERLNINSGAYELLKQSTTVNGESTDVIIRLNMANARGSGKLMKKSDSRTTGWPSDYVNVWDVNGRELTVSYLMTSQNSNQIEIGVSGGRDSTQFAVRLSSGFPYAFLILSPSQLIECDETMSVTSSGTSPGGGGVSDTASYDAGSGSFVIKFTSAVTHIMTPDEGATGGKLWGPESAVHMVNFYEADATTGAYNKNALLSIRSTSIGLSEDGKTLDIRVDPAGFTVGKRYAIVLLGFLDASNYAPITKTDYLATVGRGSGIAIQKVGAYVESSGVQPVTVFRVELSKAFTDSVPYDNQTTGQYAGSWQTNASQVVELYRVDNSVRTQIAVSTVAKLSEGNALDIVTTERQAVGTFAIVIKGVRAEGSSFDTTLMTEYKLNLT